MPDVVGKTLDVALSDLDRAGVNEDDVEVAGGGLFGIVDKSNWQVCEQLPESGATVDGEPRLVVDRSCGEDDEDPTEEANEPAAEPTEEASAEPAAEERATVQTSPQLAALLALTDSCSPEVAQLASQFEGKLIEFDGNIGAMNPHGSAKTRYDMLILPGDYSETSASGPSFTFEDVNTTFDMHYSGDTPDTIGPGANLHIVARVGKYEPNNGCLFPLEPVETSFR